MHNFSPVMQPPRPRRLSSELYVRRRRIISSFTGLAGPQTPLIERPAIDHNQGRVHCTGTESGPRDSSMARQPPQLTH